MGHNFQFIPLTESHFELLYTWFVRPHVTEWWDDVKTLADVKITFREKIENPYVFPHLVLLDEKPIGYIQAYVAKTDDPDDAWWPDAEEGTVGVDQFIGEADMLGQGYGSAFVKDFTDKLLARDDVKKVQTDPDPTNARAIRAYEKADFVAVEEIVTPDGPALLMIKD